MANRYWVGGTGNWNDTARWSETSGGAGGASVPTAADNVYFDANSFAANGTVTINAHANCLDMDWTGLDQSVTLSNAAFNLSIYGSLTLAAGLTCSFTGTGYTYFRASDTRFINTNGVLLPTNFIFVDLVSGTLSLQSNIESGGHLGRFIFVSGTIITNNFNMKFHEWRLDFGTKSFYAGNSTLVATNGFIWPPGSTTNNFAFYGESTKILVSGGGWAVLADKSFHTVELTYAGTNIGSLVGNFTCANLIRRGPGNVLDNMLLRSSITVTNSLQLYGYNSTNTRLLILSDIIGTPRTITCNGTIAASNVDFRDITLAGTANRDLSSIPGGSGDCGGNSGIIFTPSQTQYFKHTSGACNWSDASKWFSNFERTVAGRVPLPQDDAMFDENSFSGNSTLNVNVSRLGRTANMASVNKAVGMVLQNAVITFGGINFGSLVTLSGNFLIEGDFHGKSNTQKLYAGVPSSFVNHFNIIGNSIINEIEIAPGNKLRIQGGTTHVINKLIANGSSVATIIIASTNTTQFILQSSFLQNANYCNISYSNATPANRFFAGRNSVNGGNNTGWVFARGLDASLQATAAAALAALAQRRRNAAIAAFATAQLQITALRQLFGQAAITGTGNINLQAVKKLFGNATLQGDATLLIEVIRQRYSAASLQGEAGMQLLASAIYQSTMQLTATGLVTISATRYIAALIEQLTLMSGITLSYSAPSQITLQLTLQSKIK